MEQLQKNLNIAFLIAGAGLVANVIDEQNLSIDRITGEKGAYEIWKDTEGGYLDTYVTVYIPETRDSPADGDAVFMSRDDNWAEAVTSILTNEFNDKLEGILERANLEINPEDGGLF